MYISLAFVLVNIYSMAFVEASQSLPKGDSSDSAIQYEGGADVVCIAQWDRTQIPYSRSSSPALPALQKWLCVSHFSPIHLFPPRRGFAS